MGSNQFCLRWNNHQSNLLNVFDELLASELFADVTLACDGTAIKAHKVVLSACSSFFQELFKDNPCKHPIVILKDVRYVDLKAIVKFMYKGEVNITQDQLPPLLKAADALRVKGLVEITQDQQQQVMGEAGNDSTPQTQPILSAAPTATITHQALPTVTAAPQQPTDSFIMTPQLIPMIFQPTTQTIKKPNKVYERRLCPITSNVATVSNNEPVQSAVIGLKAPIISHQNNIVAATSPSNSPAPKVVISEQPLPLTRVVTTPSATSNNVKEETIDDSPNSTNDDGTNTDSDYPTESFPVFPENDINNSQPAYRIDMTTDEMNTESIDLPPPPSSTPTASTSDANGDEMDYNQNEGIEPSYTRLFSLTQTTTKPFKCPRCNKLFNQRYNMKKHLTHFHAPRHVRHYCEACPKSFRWKEDLNKHMDKMHNRQKRFQCILCSAFFHHFWRMEQHITKYHANSYSNNLKTCYVERDEDDD